LYRYAGVVEHDAVAAAEVEAVVAREAAAAAVGLYTLHQFTHSLNAAWLQVT
jgi:hypothetical protein